MQGISIFLFVAIYISFLSTAVFHQRFSFFTVCLAFSFILCSFLSFTNMKMSLNAHPYHQHGACYFIIITENEWHTQDFDFLILQSFSPFRGAPTHAEFQTSCFNLKIRGLETKLCVAYVYQLKTVCPLILNLLYKIYPLIQAPFRT